MTEILCRGQVDALNLFQLLAACQESQEPEESLLLTEQLPTHFVNAQERRNMLRFEIYGPDVDIATYTSGRLFQNDFELHWEQQNSLFQVVYLGSEQNKARLNDFNLKEDTTFRDRLESEKLEYREKKYYLFGEQMDEDEQREYTEPVHGKSFVELRIPRLLYYPVHSSSRYVQLVVREYIDKETGRVEYFRFQALEPTVEQ
jgi:CRISPR-associated protein (TIGR03984 family)